MADSAYIEEKLAQHDPDFQLTSRFVEPARRRHLAAIHVYRAELRGLLCKPGDPGVAMARLAWWQEEWARFAAGQPRHPVTRTLVHGKQGLPRGLIECLAELSQLVNGRCWETLDELVNSARLMATPLADLERRSREDDGHLDRLWTDIQLLALIQDLPGCWRNGRVILPLDLAARLQVDRSALGNDATLATRVVSELAGSVNDQLLPVGSADQHATIYHALCRSRMLGLARAGRQGSEAGPGSIRRLIIVWRAARRIRRSH